MLNRLNHKIIKLPVVGPAIRELTRYISARSFDGSESYWRKRYEKGGNSGRGSFNKFAHFKAEVINQFVNQEQINTVIEFGCGDGNQLRLATYPYYTGYDISATALAKCQALFKDDPNKRFQLMKEYSGAQAELTLSLDVIYHLIEDDIFDAYMRQLFGAATRFVIIYSSNQDEQDEVVVAHVKHRRFTDWVESSMADRRLHQHIPNRYPMTDDPTTGSFADFYIYAPRPYSLTDQS